MAKAILTIQLGDLSNVIGAHWWNMQVRPKWVLKGYIFFLFLIIFGMLFRLMFVIL